ncbi:Bifunctional dethiobiotin synthetase/adenosylmethionine-8-amino-7-oxononanoate aminotransferase [Exophiala dermatitidis]
MLWRDLKAWQVYGANTDVGKTIVSTILCRALERRAWPNGLLYLKPVSTGPQAEADDRHIRQYVPGIDSKCISQFSQPLSPHLAAQRDGNSSIHRSDASIVRQIKEILSNHSQAGGRYAILETAGGVLSPGPSGSLQADLYRPLRLPTLLIGDSKLGGISTTISAFESLHVRGYDLDSVILFDDPQWGNYGYLERHFHDKHGVATHALPLPPPRRDNPRDDEAVLADYYQECSESASITNLIDLLQQKHFSRVSKLTSMPSKAESVIWHPFRQHGIPHNIIAIDSAYGDYFQAYNQESDPALTSNTQGPTTGLTPLAAIPPAKPLLTPLFDASASWWTQGLGHGNPDLALTAAHAAGRYGHVMFAHAVHEPALDLSYNLLSTLKNPRLNRVFFTDNGSTGMEVAVKMALRASCQRYGWSKPEEIDNNAQRPVSILGLKGSYHGDTIGVMNCSEPNVFNEKVDWHQPWGHWFEPPSLLMRQGKWELTLPDDMEMQNQGPNTQKFSSLDEIFDFDSRAADAARYEQHIKSTLNALIRDQGRRFGALILEPLLMGAGGMIFVDPLFQRSLITVIRSNPELIGTPVVNETNTTSTAANWSGLPVIADEVFTGLYRLGRASSSSFLSSHTDNVTPSTAEQPQSLLPASIAPDISVHAKLLTAGLLPLALTTASESIFQTFLSSSKTDALLHGHSYTAHPIGCMVANKALDEYRRMDTDGSWDAFKKSWLVAPPASTTTTTTTTFCTSTSTSASSTSSPSRSTSSSNVYSVWSPSLVERLSHHPRIHGSFALGTVLVLKLASEGSGYTSTASSSLQSHLLTLLDAQGCGIHSRVLGDIVYFMTSLTTTQEQVERLSKTILQALDEQ